MSSLTPNRDKRRKIVLLRGMLLVAVGGLLLDSSGFNPGLAPLLLILAFGLSDLLLLLAPLRWVSSSRFEMLIGATDVILVALGIQLSGGATSALPISCLMMILVVALADYRARTVAGAAVVGALHAWLVMGPSTDATVARQLTLQMFFLCSVALYYAFLAQELHILRRRKDAQSLGRQELSTILEILGDVTSSLDLHKVTRAVVCRLTSIVPAVRCSIIFYNETASRCFVLASHDNPDVDMLEIDLQKYPELRQVIRTQSSVIVQDVSTDPLMGEVRDEVMNLDFQSIMVLPITFGDELLGSLCLKNARSKDFSQAEINFCTAVARASANALKNALLHRQVKEEAVRHRLTAEKLERILKHSLDLILTTNREGQIMEFNQSAEKLLGYSSDELQGQPCSILFGRDDGVNVLDKVRQSGALSNYSCSLQKKGGDRLEVELSLSMLTDKDDEQVGTVWIGRDVTALKEIQLQLLQAEKLSAIGEVISGVAHELNNPLSGVLGFSQLLMAKHGESPVGRELEKINESATRCQKIVKNLLSFARVHKPERKYLGVNGIIDKTLDLKKYQLRVNNVEIVRDLDPELPRTMIDFHQMQQVFLNLINNAEMAMGVRQERPARLTVRSCTEGDRILVEVTDTGAGIDPEIMPRIFDPFFTTKEQGTGTGLGLSISYGIVREHGGKIYARSREEHGTTFVVEIPVLARPASAVSDLQAEQVVNVLHPVSGNRILVVDDEPVVLDLLIRILEEQGHSVDTASTGTEAHKKMISSPYDLVLVDIRMPEMNGMDLYREIARARPEMAGKVIFMTGDLMDRGVNDFLSEVSAHMIPKPLEIKDVMGAVEAALAARSTT